MSAEAGRYDRRALQLAVLLAGAALAYSAPAPLQRVLALALPMAAFVVGPRLSLGRVGQALGSLAAMMAGLVLARATSLDVPGLLTERTLLFGLPLIFVAAFRAALFRPVYGEKLTLVAALMALTAAGRAKTGLVYPALAGATVLAALTTLRAYDPTRAPLARLTPRSFAAAAAGLILAAGLFAGARSGLPRLQEALVARMLARFQPRTGFSESMYLGSLEGLLQSDRVVLRVRGADRLGSQALLRGLLFVRYADGRWEPGQDQAHFQLMESPESPPSRSDYVELEHPGKTPRYFLPLGAGEVFASSGFYDRNALGLLRASEGAPSKRVWFREGPAPVAPPPGDAHLELPRALRPELRALLASWGVPGQPVGQRLATIERRLQGEYRYALAFNRSFRRDPVLDFLLVHKEGHCEYFASAFVLLARAAGVPTHMVAGYRLAETSPLDYGIVRERHAHAWAESWVDGRWVTFDPTPPAELAESAPSRTPLLSAAWDGLRTAWEVVDDWLSRRTAFEFSLALVLMVGGLFLVRALRTREKGGASARAERVPTEVAALFAALGRRGIVVSPSDTLKRIAERMRRAEGLAVPLVEQTAAALRDYEVLRYGGVGDEAAVLSRLREVTRALRGSRDRG